MQTFTGFTEDTFSFFMMIAFNNTPSCFEQNRPAFQANVLAPLKALSNALAPLMMEVDPQMDLRPVMGGTISRIRRDTRFTRDKSPYRDNMWLEFRRKREQGHFGLYFDISPRGADCGIGVHGLTPTQMTALRQYILANGARYRTLHEDAVHAGFSLYGPSYKRPPLRSEDPVLMDVIGRKWLAYEKPIPLQATMQPTLVDELMQDFRSLQPLYSFFQTFSI